MALVSITVESRNDRNLSSTLTQAFEGGNMVGLIANQNSDLNGNSQFTYIDPLGQAIFYTCTETVASIVASATATSVSGTTSESFSIDNDAAAYPLLKNSSGDLLLRNQDDDAYIDLTLATATFYLAAADTITIDAATTDHTATSCMTFDVDINSAASNIINQTIDVTTALSAGEIVKGLNIDYDGIAANADTSGAYGVHSTMTATSTGREDIYGFYLTLDGTRDTDDLIKGLLIDGSGLTVNSASAQLHGIVVDFDSVTDTDYLTNGFEGIYVSMPAAYQGTDVASAASFAGAGATAKILSGAATIYAIDLALAADTVAINIDAGTTDHTGSDIIACNLDVNSSAVNFISADIDVGTALSAGEVVNGISIDIDGDGADNATSELNAFYATNGGTSTGVKTGLLLDGTWDVGVDMSGSTNTTDIKLGNGATIHNTSASILTLTEASFNLVGNTTFNGAGGLTFGTGGGAADVQTVTCSPVITAYVTGMAISWVPTADNTGACTVNVDGVGAKSVKTQTGADPAAADLEADGLALAIYDGTNFVLMNPATTCD